MAQPDPIDVPHVKTLEDAERWIQIHHRWGVKDAQALAELTLRVSRLERPWWRRLFR